MTSALANLVRHGSETQVQIGAKMAAGMKLPKPNECEGSIENYSRSSPPKLDSPGMLNWKLTAHLCLQWGQKEEE